MSQEEHYSVLLHESIEGLINQPNGIYVDGTFGRGGHSRQILQKLGPDAKLIGIDKDPQAIEEGKKLAAQDSRFSIYHGSFAQMRQALDASGVGGKVDGVLLDLGVSSPQLDQAERGFSFMNDGPLDMRMNNQAGISAANWVAKAEEEEIAFVLKEFGEERFAKRMARAVVKAREEEPILTTLQFAKIITEANPRWEKGKHPATRAFQAVRIFINSELDDLKNALDMSLNTLNQHGRLVVISFHSLEDRIVKRFFKEGAKGRSFPAGVPVTEDMLDKKLRLIGKATKANASEVEENVRSRSAVLRVAERI